MRVRRARVREGSFLGAFLRDHTRSRADAFSRARKTVARRVKPIAGGRGRCIAGCALARAAGAIRSADNGLVIRGVAPEKKKLRDCETMSKQQSLQTP